MTDPKILALRDAADRALRMATFLADHGTREELDLALEEYRAASDAYRDAAVASVEGRRR